MNDSLSTRIVCLVTPNLRVWVGWLFWFQEIHVAGGVSTLQYLKTVFKWTCGSPAMNADWQLDNVHWSEKGWYSFTLIFLYHYYCNANNLLVADTGSSNRINHMDRGLLSNWSHYWPCVMCAKYEAYFPFPVQASCLSICVPTKPLSVKIFLIQSTLNIFLKTFEARNTITESSSKFEQYSLVWQFSLCFF